MWFLFGEVSSSSGAWDGLRYYIVALMGLPYTCNYFSLCILLLMLASLLSTPFVGADYFKLN